MGETPSELELTRRWVAAWKRAGPALEHVRIEELRALTEEQAARLFDSLDFHPDDVWVQDERILSLGLIEQQRLFMTSHEHPASRHSGS